MGAEMTSLERVRAAIRFEETDRVPVFPLIHYAATRVVGMKISEFARQTQNQWQRLYWLHIDVMVMDGVCSGVDVVIEAEALGSLTSAAG